MMEEDIKYNKYDAICKLAIDSLLSIMTPEQLANAEKTVIVLKNYHFNDRNYEFVLAIAKILKDLYGINLKIDLSWYSFIRFTFTHLKKHYHIKRAVHYEDNLTVAMNSNVVLDMQDFIAYLTNYTKDYLDGESLVDIYNAYYN